MKKQLEAPDFNRGRMSLSFLYVYAIIKNIQNRLYIW